MLLSAGVQVPPADISQPSVRRLVTENGTWPSIIRDAFNSYLSRNGVELESELET